VFDTSTEYYKTCNRFIGFNFPIEQKKFLQNKSYSSLACKIISVSLLFLLNEGRVHFIPENFLFLPQNRFGGRALFGPTLELSGLEGRESKGRGEEREARILRMLIA